MLEDGLEYVKNLFADLNRYTIEAKYLKMTNSVSFDEICSAYI